MQRGLAFTDKNVATDKTAFEELQRRGFYATPVVQIGEQWIAGFDQTAISLALGDPVA